MAYEKKIEGKKISYSDGESHEDTYKINTNLPVIGNTISKI